MNATLTQTQTGTVTVTETVQSHERERKPLHPAIFIVPVVIAAVAALPSVFVLLMVHAFNDLVSQLLHQPISLFDSSFNLFILSPAIFLSVSVFLVTLVIYWNSGETRASRKGRQGRKGFYPQILGTSKR